MSKREKIFAILKWMMTIALTVVLVMTASYSFKNRQKLDFFEHLDDVAATVDDQNILFRDLAFYLLYEESNVERTARIYNPQSPKDYWNAHIDDMFVQEGAKDAIMGMALHDELYYQMALAEGMTLTSEDEDDIAKRTEDFWEDLYDEQLDRLPCSVEEIDQQIRKSALAQKYMYAIADSAGKDWMAYNYDGYFYLKEKENHKVKINEKLWKRLVVGDITLVHTKVNYINGVNGPDED